MMTPSEWENLKVDEGDPLNVTVRDAIGWVAVYKDKAGAEWHWPVVKFLDMLTPGFKHTYRQDVIAYSRADLFVSTTAIRAMADGSDTYENDDSVYAYKYGDFEFSGYRYVGEATYIQAYATFIDTWPDSEGE